MFPESAQLTLIHKETANLFWSEFKQTLLTFWRELSWQDIAQLYTVCVGIYIGLQEGIIPESALYSGLIGGSLGFFAHPLLEGIVHAPMNLYKKHLCNRATKAQITHKVELLHSINQFTEAYSIYNPFLCSQIKKMVMLKLNMLQIDLTAVRHNTETVENASRRINTLHILFKTAVNSLEGKGDDLSTMEQALLNMHIFLSSLTIARMDERMVQMEEAQASSRLLTP